MSDREGVLIRAGDAGVQSLAGVVLPAVDGMQPCIRVTLEAFPVAGHSDVWWLELRGINRKPLTVRSNLERVQALREAGAPLVFAKHLSHSAVFLAAERVANTVEQASYIFLPDSDVGSGSFRCTPQPRVARWTEGRGPASHDAGLEGLRDVVPGALDINVVFDRLEAKLAWRLAEGRRVLSEPRLLASAPDAGRLTMQ